MKTTLKSVLILAVAVGTASFTNTNKTMKKVNIKSSTIEWTGKKVTGSHTGTIALKEGHFEMEGDVLTGGAFIIDMPTITVTDLKGENKGKLEGHLKSPDFFGIEKYPEAKLVITEAVKSDTGYTVTGDLTIKETTESINFELNMEGNTATTTLKVDRTKFGIKYGSGSFFDNLGDNMINDNFELAVTLKM